MREPLEPRRPPNPLDPLDDFKRWFRELWPIEQLGVVLGMLLVLVLLVLWATR